MDTNENKNMNNFIQDNFKVGDNIKVYCNGRFVEGVLIGLDEYYLEIKDSKDVIHQLQGNVTPNFREIQTRSVSSNNDTSGDNSLMDNTTNRISAKFHETDTEKNMRIGLKILGKIAIESTPKKGLSSVNIKKGYLPYDGEIKAYRDDWNYCFVTDYNNPSIVIHLNLQDFFDAEDLNKKRMLRKGLPIHYFLYKDERGYHAHVAFHEMLVEKYLEECRNSDIEREKDESESYVRGKLNSLLKSGESDSAYSLIFRIVSDKHSDNDYSRMLIDKQIEYANSVGDSKSAISAYNLLLSSARHLSKKEESSIYYEIAKLQMEDDMDREVLEVSIQKAIDIDPQNLEAKEFKKIILQMPRKEQHNDNDLLIDEEDDLLLPSVLISKDPDAVDAFGDLINDPQNKQQY